MAPPAALPRGVLAAAAASAVSGDEPKEVAPPLDASPLSRPGRGAWSSKRSGEMQTEVAERAMGTVTS